MRKQQRAEVMRINAVPGVLAGVLFCAPLAAQEYFEPMILSELHCAESPSPLPVLEALEGAGFIRSSELYGYDSISCFPIRGALTIYGLQVDAVCAHEEDSSIMNERPDLLYRGPGTSPGQSLSFGTSAARAEVEDWYAEHLGTRKMGPAIEEGDTMSESPIEIGCSSWISG